MAATRRGAAWLAVVILVSIVSCTSDPEAAKRAYLAKGNESLQAGKPREAIVQYRNALKHDPRFGEARFQLGEAHLAAGNNQAAYTEFMRAADLMRDDRRVQQRAGEMLLLAGRFEDAKSLAERLLKKNIRDADAQLLLGYSLAGLKDIPGAIAEIEKGIGEASNRFSAYANLGLLQRASGDLVRAESAFKNAIAVAPQSPRAHLALAGFYWSTQRTNEAEQTLKRAHEVGSGDPSVNRALAMF